MAKGMYTQGVCVMLDRPALLDEIEAALGDFEIVGQRDAAESWAFGGPTLVVAYRPDVNGLVAIDTVDQPWPDGMGDGMGESGQEQVFGAWVMGSFGPYAYPGNLDRAARQCWAWEPGHLIPEQHSAFIRVRSSYAFGAEEDDPIMPEDYEPLPELEFVTKLAAALLDLPGALCYFNPNGEVLRGQDSLREGLNYGWAHNLPPLDVWSNARVFKLNPEWTLMDTVGNAQLDLPDFEACFHSESYDVNTIANLLRNVTLYVLRNGEVIKDGDTMDGPGDVRWQSRPYDNGLSDPPRRVLRFLPQDGREVPEEVLSAGDEEAGGGGQGE